MEIFRAGEAHLGVLNERLPDLRLQGCIGTDLGPNDRETTATRIQGGIEHHDRTDGSIQHPITWTTLPFHHLGAQLHEKPQDYHV